jgi:Fe-Mn family superoxide dismutase
MAYELPKLPYAYAALEPHIDARTMEIHHGKHHQAYITNANNLLKDHAALAALDVNALIADLSKVPRRSAAACATTPAATRTTHFPGRSWAGSFRGSQPARWRPRSTPSSAASPS